MSDRNVDTSTPNLFSCGRSRERDFFEIRGAEADPSREALRISASGVNAFKRLNFAGEFTARVTPVPIPNTEVKPRWADGTARVSVWEIR